LGRLLAERHITLVYGGAYVGLMKVLSDAVHTQGGKTVGVIPRLINDKKGADPHLSELLLVEDMRTRKQEMERRADAYIVLPGGIGTVDELYDAIVQKELGYHAKPIVIVNIHKFYDKWLDFFAEGVRQKFMRDIEQRLFHVVGGVEEIFPYLESYRPTPHEDKWL
jgi:uncharacterized protein (TIGR00730 family)